MKKGTASPHTTLRAEDVLRIRKVVERGISVARGLADQYGVAPSTIQKIWRGDTFRHVGTGVEGETSLETPEGEPGTAEIAASLARLQQAVDAAPRTGRDVARDLEELSRKGAGFFEGEKE